MSWFSKWFFDPIKTAAEKLIASADADLKALGQALAAKVPTTPLPAAAETAFETNLTNTLDAAISASLGPVPLVGAALTAEAEAAEHAIIDYLTQKGVAMINSLAAHAKAQVSAAVTPPPASPPSTAA